ncbi:MAG TPA: hydrogenase small subunit [Methylomusa anaerophila]|uniref:Periplasmic [NiFeSe] hydrogenase small subunit n=1 Tax=Methylomusa anaerophila TaxID=1930071 RepID=A0A348AGN7_9FIRM|nr:hydrogenase small subunit [Methylomusa anaerophila]BBB90235.1 periplasmic [NiFeSe] hydrogenase small subunit precursor [Methylomusa anaerophila]HML89417.1 hydrogenase small subunit [Methylomusa anaerophila]
MLTRREFLKLCASSAFTMSLGNVLLPFVRQAFAENMVAKPPVVWLELGSCTGNSVSLQNSMNPSLDQVILDMLDIRYHWVFNTAQGEAVVEALYDTLNNEAGKFWLVVEGAVMTAANGQYNHIYMRNGKMVTGMAALAEFAPKAKYIVAVGSCACFGGPSAAYPNPGGAKSVREAVNRQVINVPGCPAHPDWMTGTFSHLLMYGIPDLDAYNRPKMFFGRTIHELCQRRQQFEDGVFASFPGESGCLFKIGCKGPVTHADCPLRQWNGYVNWPVRSGTPCIGCASPGFPDSSMPFYNHLPNFNTPAGALNIKKFGATAAGLGIAAVGAHLITGVVSKRIGRHWQDGTRPKETDPPENLAQLKQELDDAIRQQNALISESKALARRGKVRRRLKKSWRQKLMDFIRPSKKMRKE